MRAICPLSSLIYLSTQTLNFPARPIYQRTPADAIAKSDSLARSHHSINLIDGDLYIWGGLVGSNLAGSEMHILKLSNVGSSGSQYKSVPALSETDVDGTPCARAGHTATTISGKIFLFGGYAPKSPNLADSSAKVWLFDPTSYMWKLVHDGKESLVASRYGHSAVSQKEKLIIHGGYTTDEKPLTDTWAFDTHSLSWSQLPSLEHVDSETSTQDPASATAHLAIYDDKLCRVSGPSKLVSQVHVLDLKGPPEVESTEHVDGDEAKPAPIPWHWHAIEVPTNPVTPGPHPRQGSALLPVSTGLGRSYLLLLLGEKHDPSTPRKEPAFLSDMYTLQLPSPDTTPAQAKDAAREKLPVASHTNEWTEVDIVPREEEKTNPYDFSEVPGAGLVRSIGESAGGMMRHIRSKSGLGAMFGGNSESTAKSEENEKPATTLSKEEGDEVKGAQQKLEEIKLGDEPGPATSSSDKPPTDFDQIPEATKPKLKEEEKAEKEPEVSEPSSQPTPAVTVSGSKSHPGPRAYFGSTTVDGEGRKLVIWGGVNAKSECEGDGWMLEFRV